jgi:hypothetical protein
VYRIQKAESAKPRVVHYNRLKPYHGDYDNWLDKNAVIAKKIIFSKYPR